MFFLRHSVDNGYARIKVSLITVNDVEPWNAWIRPTNK